MCGAADGADFEPRKPQHAVYKTYCDLGLAESAFSTDERLDLLH